MMNANCWMVTCTKCGKTYNGDCGHSCSGGFADGFGQWKSRKQAAMEYSKSKKVGDIGCDCASCTDRREEIAQPLIRKDRNPNTSSPPRKYKTRKVRK